MEEVKEIVIIDNKFYDLQSGKELILTNSEYVEEKGTEKFVLTFEIK